MSSGIDSARGVPGLILLISHAFTFAVLFVRDTLLGDVGIRVTFDSPTVVLRLRGASLGVPVGMVHDPRRGPRSLGLLSPVRVEVSG